MAWFADVTSPEELCEQHIHDPLHTNLMHELHVSARLPCTASWFPSEQQFAGAGTPSHCKCSTVSSQHGLKIVLPNSLCSLHTSLYAEFNCHARQADSSESTNLQHQGPQPYRVQHSWQTACPEFRWCIIIMCLSSSAMHCRLTLLRAADCSSRDAIL